MELRMSGSHGSSGRRSGKGQGARGVSTSLTSSARSIATELDYLRQSEVAYKARIRSLEMEVSMLKSRLDGLRKAKNTTIVRREREEIRVSSPSIGRLPSMATEQVSHLPQCNHGNLLEKTKDLNFQVSHLNSLLLSEKAKYEQLVEVAAANHENELVTLKSHHKEKMQALAAELEDRFKKDREQDGHNHGDLQSELKHLRAENSDLSCQLEEVLMSNEALRGSSTLLQEKSEALLEELSVKEAEWSQREDRLKAEIRNQWGERYQEWMTKAERKMEELQQINTLLQSMLKTKQDNDL